jgi:glycerol-3-phosphate acyltransferase PlsY
MLGMLFFVLLTYLVAAVPFGVAVTTLFGGDVDVRAAGSGNIGTTNVARVYGWGLAGPVLLLDAAKGFFPVIVAFWVWPEAGSWWPFLVAATAFVGHCWPVYLEFRGGKGVATGAGGLLALAPLPTLLAVAVWVVALAVTGRSSVAALVATVSMVGISAIWAPDVVWFAIAFALAVIATHTVNIRRLISGQEATVIRPVRLRRDADALTAERVLGESPAGDGPAPALWRETVVDALEEGQVDEGREVAGSPGAQTIEE